MRNKTYRNFLRVMKMIQDKGYSESEAEKLTHLVFDNVTSDKGKCDRTAEYFVGKILTKAEFEAEYC